MSMIAEHMSAIKQSAASVVSARAVDLRQQGKDVISLSAGEPDFATPQHVQLAGIRAIVEGKTKYPPIPGIMPLREAICRKLKRENDLDYAPTEVIAGNGAKQVIFNALAVTLDPGDEVIVPAPYFGCYVEETALCKGVAVVVETTAEDGFRLDPARLEAAITPRTKWLILNNPNNPSGAVLGIERLKEIAEVLRRHPQVWVLSDDIYEHLIYDGVVFHSILEVAPDLKDRTLVVNGFSKTFCMTGWRLGYGAGPLALIKNMTKYQSQSTSGACQVSQWAGVAGLDGDMGFAAKQRAIFQDRRDLVVGLLGAVPGLGVVRPEGAFYVYLSCRELIGKLTPKGDRLERDADVANYLLDEGVAVIPGEAFGLSPFFRISFATDTKTLEEACRRIAAACAKLA
ncbi:Aspartate aminotransferase A [uncultured Alphaproteobacteria bacterium]|uniref:aspartate transaminase n=1 Tax=uncultured Alphaproteobacteria bacterium TaxID=91750 RepID=A0A212JSD2_9PROT|nr:Aspartate aminotransferase A [uncultured Alphaproteobacteria bacterium]